MAAQEKIIGRGFIVKANDQVRSWLMRRIKEYFVEIKIKGFVEENMPESYFQVVKAKKWTSLSWEVKRQILETFVTLEMKRYDIKA